MPNDLVVVLLCVACVCLGVALRGYYDGGASLTAEMRPSKGGQRHDRQGGAAGPGATGPADPRDAYDLRTAALLVASWQVPVKFLDLPRFVRRMAEDKQIARFLIARDTFEPIR